MRASNHCWKSALLSSVNRPAPRATGLFRKLAVVALLSGMPISASHAMQPADNDAGEGVVQTGSGTPAARSGNSPLVVTARRREELLIEVPISMSTFSSEDIAARGINDLRDLEFAVPNLSSSGVDNNIGTNISIRGISNDARNIGFETGVSVYVDGVFSGRPSSYNLDMLDVERIEVLRGPQGTLFGKNTIAGAINIVTRRPDDEFRGMAEFQYGNYDQIIARTSLSGPLSESVFAGIRLYRRERDGFQTNVFNGQDLYTEDQWGGQIQLRFRPSSSLDIMIAADILEDDYIPNVNELEPGSFGFDQAPANRDASVDAPVFQTRDIFGLSLTAEYVFANDMALTSISGYRSTDTEFLSDDDATSLPFLTSSFIDEQEQFTQELRLTSGSDSSVDFTAGLYFLWQDVTTDRLSAIPPNTIAGPFGVAVSLDANVETRSFAPFGQVDFHVTDALTITAGARYTWVDKDIDINLIGSPAFQIIDLNTSDSRSDSALSFTFGPSYRVNENVNLYARVARGFKAGGFNADFVGADTIEFDSEFVTNYEVGVKFASSDGRNQLNLAAFYMDYTDLQVIRFEQFAGFIITNAGEASIYGLELDANVEPFDGFTITGGLGYLHATFDSFEDGGGPGVDFDGNRLADAPRWTFSVAAQYEHDLGGAGSIFARGEYSHRASTFSRASNDMNSFIDDFGLVNARIGYRTADESLGIELWARNLTNEEYINDRGTPPLGGLLGQTGRNFGAPRTYGVRVIGRF